MCVCVKGLTFARTAEICFVRLKLLLVAIDGGGGVEGGPGMVVNPGQQLIQAGTTG